MVRPRCAPDLAGLQIIGHPSLELRRPLGLLGHGLNQPALAVLDPPAQFHGIAATTASIAALLPSGPPS